MEIRISDIKKILQNLLNEEISREEAANWATKFREAADENQLVYSPPNLEKIIWESVLFIEGIDLEDGPGSYLHNKEDIYVCLEKILDVV